MNRLLPVTARLRKKIFGSRSISDSASEILELAPAESRIQPAAICLPGEFYRVIAVEDSTTLNGELERVQAGRRLHGPTIAYRVDNATVADGSLYFKGGHEVIRRHSSPPLLPNRLDSFREMQLCTDGIIEQYFGHWLRDGLLLELLAEQRSMPALRLNSERWLHEPGYRELSGLEPVRTRHARIDELWVIDDRGLNSSRITRFEKIRGRIRSRVASDGTKRVMVTRGKLGAKRELVNSDEVHCALARLGFEIVHPEEATPRSLVEKLSEAEIAIVVEGSAHNHCLLAMRPGAALLTIQPPTRFNCVAKAFADAIGVHWGYVVADPDAEGFRLSVDRLFGTLDEVARVTSNLEVA